MKPAIFRQTPETPFFAGSASDTPAFFKKMRARRTRSQWFLKLAFSRFVISAILFAAFFGQAPKTSFFAESAGLQPAFFKMMRASRPRSQGFSKLVFGAGLNNEEWESSRRASMPESVRAESGHAPTASDGASDGASDNPRVIIERILASEEFRNVKKPQMTWLEKIRFKITEFFVSLLRGFVSHSAFPVISKSFVWVLAGAAFIILAVWILNMFRQASLMESVIASKSAPVAELPWTECLLGAHKAAAAGDWREAVHLAYRSGISFLESNGVWPPDRTRTPREYLRILPSSNEHRATLADMTRIFEITWYGGAHAGPESFSESLDCLERMGCHSN